MLFSENTWAKICLPCTEDEERSTIASKLTYEGLLVKLIS
jgi:hypothetical protein